MHLAHSLVKLYEPNGRKVKRKSLLQHERRREIERKIFRARMSCEIARKRSSAPLRTIYKEDAAQEIFADRSRSVILKEARNEKFSPQPNAMGIQFQRRGDAMTKVYGINGSPRKKWNTATLLENALNGAASLGAETELVHLYDLAYQGCTSCFSCKLKDGKSYGRCAMNDDLTPVLDKLLHADGFILGSPIYFGTVSGEMRSFMERLLFPHLVYASPPGTIFPRVIPTAFIYTMNVSEEQMRQLSYPVHFSMNEKSLRRTFGKSETLCAFETLQFDDYDKVVFSYVDPEKRRQRRQTVFPEDCRKAIELGVRLVQQVQP